MSTQPVHTPADERAFTRRVLIVAAVATVFVAMAAAFLYGIDVWILWFAGVLLAIVLHSLTKIVSKYARISHAWGLTVVTLTVVAILGGLFWFLGATISNQTDKLVQDVPRAWQQVEDKLQQQKWGQLLLGERSNAQQSLKEQAPKQVGSAVKLTLNLLGGFVLVFFVGLLMAVDPKPYRNAILHLVPHRKKKRAAEVLNALYVTLQRWLFGKLLSMISAAIITTIGLWLLKVPLALTLGILAGVGEFVPNFGPIIAAIPAVLLAMLEDPMKALWVILLYIGIQTVQSYFITPFVEEKAVDLPMALIIVVQVLFGALFGVLALVFATPLAAVGLVLIKMLYVEDVIGDDVEVHGENTT